MDATLIARSSCLRLRDYESGNLQKAFPLQFPYGFGDRESGLITDTNQKRMQIPTPSTFAVYYVSVYQTCIERNMF